MIMENRIPFFYSGNHQLKVNRKKATISTVITINDNHYKTLNMSHFQKAKN